MQLHYCYVEGGNFGDDMNTWFWDEIFPDYKSLAPSVTMFGIGSLLWRRQFDPFEHVLVMGSGAGYGVTPERVPDHAEIGWVRGPHTAKLMSLDDARWITDPACMVPDFARFANVRKRGDILLIPHVGTARLKLSWERIAERAGASYLSPANDAELVISRIAAADLVITESLHGAIVADAFRVPWVVIAISPTFNTFKFGDWAASMDLDLKAISALNGAKRLFRAYRSLGAFATKANANGVASPSSVSSRISADEKDVARNLFARFATVIEPMLINDVRRAAKRPQQLSDSRILAARQRRIRERINEVRECLVAAMA